MSDSRRTSAPASNAGAADELQVRLQTLRSEGGWRADPARFHYLEALARRVAEQPDTVRRLLQARLTQGLAELTGRSAEVHQGAGDVRDLHRVAPESHGAPASAPLAELNRYIRTATNVSPHTPSLDGPPDRDELPNARRFRLAWSRIRTQDQVQQAVSRKPANAGPLNSHALVLQSLACMGELSPDYLRRFVAHVEALQWLDQAREKYPDPQAKQAKGGKPKRGRQKK